MTALLETIGNRLYLAMQAASVADFRKLLALTTQNALIFVERLSANGQTPIFSTHSKQSQVLLSISARYKEP
jgi:hypothetical protein